MKNEVKTDRMKVIGRGTYEWIDKLGEYRWIVGKTKRGGRSVRVLCLDSIGGAC